MPKSVRLITDGACSANGRERSRGGWAAILRVPGAKERVLVGGEAPSTNNRMELIAAIEGLRATPDGADVSLLTDSSYVANAIAKGWLASWQRKGWLTADRKPVANRELWEELLAEMARMTRVRPTLVRGHAGHDDNERADRLAVEATRKDWPARGGDAPSRAGEQLGLDF
jgi:ribonuclease HI